MSMCGNLLTGAYLKTIAASFWPGCSSDFGAYLDCTGADLERRMEFEWFNFRETPDSLAQKDFADLHTLTPGMPN